MLAKKYLLLLFKAVGVYILIFICWAFVSKAYLHSVGFLAGKLYPLVAVENFRFDSHQLELKQSDQAGNTAVQNQWVISKVFKYLGKEYVIRFNVRVGHEVRFWVKFGTNDLSYPLVTFITLVLVTPGMGWKKRGKSLIFGVLVLLVFYSILALVFFRLTSFVRGAEFADLGWFEDIIGIERLARWKQGGGIAILMGQFVPVGIWFLTVLPILLEKGRALANKNLPASGSVDN